MSLTSKIQEHSEKKEQRGKIKTKDRETEKNEIKERKKFEKEMEAKLQRRKKKIVLFATGSKKGKKKMCFCDSLSESVSV